MRCSPANYGAQKGVPQKEIPLWRVLGIGSGGLGALGPWGLGSHVGSKLHPQSMAGLWDTPRMCGRVPLRSRNPGTTDATLVLVTDIVQPSTIIHVMAPCQLDAC